MPWGWPSWSPRSRCRRKSWRRRPPKAIETANPTLNAVVETYPDRIEDLDETTLGNGPFRGVPLLIKDVFGHEKGRKIEFGSRLCKGMVVEEGTYLVDMLKAAGVNIMGRSAAPEYSMSASTESAMFGNTSNPWKKGYSAGGSSGGAQAAVTSGMVPIAHGSDIGGSIRIPASLCGGVGLKPSRGRVSIGPVVDEGGFGYSMNFIQAKTVRDAAAMLDCLAAPAAGRSLHHSQARRALCAARRESGTEAQDRHGAQRAGRREGRSRGGEGGRGRRQGARGYGSYRSSRRMPTWAARQP